MHQRTLRLLTLLLSCVCLGTACASPKGATLDQKRTYAVGMRDAALADFLFESPELRPKVENSAGYAVFDNVAVHPVLFGFAGGYGVAHDNETGLDTHMRMSRYGFGLGLTAEGENMLMIFRDRLTYEDFVRGRWCTGTATEASFQFGTVGAGVARDAPASDNIETYVRTHTGVALDAVVSGARFTPVRELSNEVRER